MKMSARDGAAFLRSPREDVALVLLFGPDAMRNSLTRQDFLKKVLGDTAEEDMRLTRMTGAELRSNAAALQDAMKAIGFFPGKRGVLVTDAGDGIADIAKDALSAWEPGDAIIVIEAGNLTKGSRLRKMAEAAANAAPVGIYAEAPSRAMVEDLVADAKIPSPDPDAMSLLVAYASAMDPGDFRQFLEKLSLYTLGASAVTVPEVEACAPSSTDQDLDDVIATLADGDAVKVGPKLERMAAQGVNPTTLCIAATRYFRQLHVAASDPGGPGSGIARLRPPVFGPRRDRMQRQARSWGMFKLERALTVLMDTDLSLRSAANHPAMALAERAFIRIAMMNPKGR